MSARSDLISILVLTASRNNYHGFLWYKAMDGISEPFIALLQLAGLFSFALRLCFSGLCKRISVLIYLLEIDANLFLRIWLCICYRA